jgi:zinc finger protein CreA/MIG
MHIADPVSSRSSSSPDNSYSPTNHHPLSMQSNSTSLPGFQFYSYCGVTTTTYQEQSQGAGFTYVDMTPIHSTSNSANNFSYSNAHGTFGNHNLPHMNSMAAVIHNTRHNSEQSISGMTSRHSISHISPPHSYSQAQSSSGGPPSPASLHSVSSHTSGPPTLLALSSMVMDMPITQIV